MMNLDHNNNNNNNIITFVIPSLNRPTLGRTIDSLLRQSNPNWQCIVVFDGCAGVSFADPRIRTVELLVRQGENIQVRDQTCGLAGRVRNVGIKLCQTEWVGFVDDDDTLDPEYVSVLYSSYHALPVEVVVWRMRRTDGVVLPPVEECSNTTLRRNYVGISFCFKRHLGVFFQGNSQFEDFLFLQQLVQAAGGGDRVLIAPEVFYYVNQDVCINNNNNNNSIINNNYNNNFNNSIINNNNKNVSKFTFCLTKIEM